ncbi:HPr family phosphocarrier protein [Cellulomonas sp. HZM]|uniref:HPr family phosphocarrier protein n=1 Tax=Cellulomonas sp. HZM TaxID=1454010 RepID=UPI000493B1F2|nr:HPr family phosphocarrier protein [Cellulomonas sp. HZM]
MQRSVVVSLADGLHARPAAQFVAAAARQPVAVSITKDGSAPAATSSILAIMTLGVRQGDEVLLTADDEGPAGTAALDELEALLHEQG